MQTICGGPGIDCKRLVLGIVNDGRTSIEHNVWSSLQDCPLTSGWGDEIFGDPNKFPHPPVNRPRLHDLQACLRRSSRSCLRDQENRPDNQTKAAISGAEVSGVHLRQFFDKFLNDSW